MHSKTGKILLASQITSLDKKVYKGSAVYYFASNDKNKMQFQTNLN